MTQTGLVGKIRHQWRMYGCWNTNRRSNNTSNNTGKIILCWATELSCIFISSNYSLIHIGTLIHPKFNHSQDVQAPSQKLYCCEHQVKFYLQMYIIQMFLKKSKKFMHITNRYQNWEKSFLSLSMYIIISHFSEKS